MATRAELLDQAEKLNVSVGELAVNARGPGSLSQFLTDMKEHVLLLTEYLTEDDIWLSDE